MTDLTVKELKSELRFAFQCQLATSTDILFGFLFVCLFVCFPSKLRSNHIDMGLSRSGTKAELKKRLQESREFIQRFQASVRIRIPFIQPRLPAFVAHGQTGYDPILQNAARPGTRVYSKRINDWARTTKERKSHNLHLDYRSTLLGNKKKKCMPLEDLGLVFSRGLLADLAWLTVTASFRNHSNAESEIPARVVALAASFGYTAVPMPHPLTARSMFTFIFVICAVRELDVITFAAHLVT